MCIYTYRINAVILHGVCSPLVRFACGLPSFYIPFPQCAYSGNKPSKSRASGQFEPAFVAVRGLWATGAARAIGPPQVRTDIATSVFTFVLFGLVTL